MAQIARDAVGVLLGEAGGKTIGQRYRDMVHIASVMANRAKKTGVSLQDVISAPGQFSAYGKRLPPGTAKLRAIAALAMKQVETQGPVTNATFYATPAAVSKLPSNLDQETETAAHQYFSDPQNRAIRTAQGYIAPAATADTPAAQAMASASPRSGLGMAALTGRKDKLGRMPIGQVDFGSLGLNPAFAARMQDYADRAKALGLDLSVDVSNARRTKEQQQAIKNAGFSKTLNSYHVPGFAVDITSTRLNSLNQPEPTTQAAARQLARDMGLGLLGSWDPGHIQVNVPGLKASTLMSMPTDGLGNVQLSPSQDLAVRSDSVPTPTERPADITSPYSPAPASDPDTMSPGFAVASAPAASAPIASSPETAAAAFASETSPAAQALAGLAAKADDPSFSEVADNPVGKPAPAYATTNLPGFGYEPAAVAQTQDDPVSIAQQPEPVDIAPPAIVQPQIAYTEPEPVAAKAYSPPAPSVPTGAQASYDFHSGLNNMAVATNGNTLSRDSLGFSYNYSPSYDVTTISDPTGKTVGVRKGFVSGETADADASGSGGGGLFGGLGKMFSGVGDAIGGTLSKDSVSNGIVGGLGGLGGGVIGGMFGGPIGGIIGSAIGQNLAVAHNPFTGPSINTFAGPMHMAAARGGLGFPSAPSVSKTSKGGKGPSISAAARASVNAGKGGLY